MFERYKNSLNDDLDVFFGSHLTSGGSIYPCCVFTLNLQDASTVTSPWDCSCLEKSCSTSNTRSRKAPPAPSIWGDDIPAESWLLPASSWGVHLDWQNWGFKVSKQSGSLEEWVKHDTTWELINELTFSVFFSLIQDEKHHDSRGRQSALHDMGWDRWRLTWKVTLCCGSGGVCAWEMRPSVDSWNPAPVESLFSASIHTVSYIHVHTNTTSPSCYISLSEVSVSEEISAGSTSDVSSIPTDDLQTMVEHVSHHMLFMGHTFVKW